MSVFWKTHKKKITESFLDGVGLHDKAHQMKT
jgi:hypothetical protein